jgi:glutamyl-tRNA reductase
VPLEALERLLIAPRDLPKALADLVARPHLDEVVVLSTCMRTEVYALVNRFHGAMADIREFLVAWSGAPPEELSGELYSYFDESAVHHLFRVSSGLDSASVGEPEVLGQVRQAWEAARHEGACGPALGAAFRHALQAGKRARTETGISRGTTSLAHAAVELAAHTLGGLEGKEALVVGVGDVGETAARAFSDVVGTGQLVVANRTRARAEQIAGLVGARVAAWEDLGPAVAAADVVACCTAGEGTLLGTGDVEEALAARPGRPMLLIDLAVPRNIDPGVARAPGATLLNMDDIGSFVAARVSERRIEVPAVERIVADEVERYSASIAARSVASLVSSARDRAERVRRAELARCESQLRQLEPGEREKVEAMTRRIVAKLLHEPTVNLKAAAGTAKGEPLADAFRALFGLEP